MVLEKKVYFCCRICRIKKVGVLKIYLSLLYFITSYMLVELAVTENNINIVTSMRVHFPFRSLYVVSCSMQSQISAFILDEILQIYR